MKREIIISLRTVAVVALIAVAFLFNLYFPQKETFEQRRSRVLGELSSAIDDAVLEGKYICCIEPPCTMCYLGNWLWEEGSCHCDEMMAEGEFDKVCPQCIRGIEEGRCKSAQGTFCEI